MESFLINLIGLTLIALIIGWFWLSKRQITVVNNPKEVVEVMVENSVYTPEHIHAIAGKTLTLRFTLRDPAPEAAVLIFSDFHISTELALDAITEILITPKAPGEYPFSCQTGQYQGVLVVRAPSCH